MATSVSRDWRPVEFKQEQSAINLWTDDDSNQELGDSLVQNGPVQIDVIQGVAEGS